MAITFDFQTSYALRNRRGLKRFIKEMFFKENKPFQNLSIILCDDDYIQNINRQFLQHDYATDIITFNFSEENVEGEIYISGDTVLSNSEEFSISFEHELHRVIFHGVLHLCGYLDKTVKDQAVMTKKEDFYLGSYFGKLV